MFESCKRRFETLAILFISSCQCLSEETLKVVGPFYIVPMPGEIKCPAKVGKMLLVADFIVLEKDNSEVNHSCVSPTMGCLECISKT